MKNPCAIILLMAGALSAETVTTPPLGFNKVTCLSNSDTIVGVPFRMQGSLTARLTSSPQIDAGNSDLATLEVESAILTAGALNSHYLKFTSGPKSGRWFDITPGTNTASTVVIDLNGDNLAGVGANDTVLIAEYWTLDTLFPPANATTTWTETPPGSGDWVQNGHAVVASATASQTTRQSEILLPNAVGTGVNRLSTELYYITGGIWRKSGVSGDFGGVVLPPDWCFTIRHRSLVQHPTAFRSLGEVEMGVFAIPLATNVLITGSERRDSYVAIFRPIDISLDQLNLVESGAFIPSSTASQATRRDELLVYSNETQMLNKIPSAVYYHTGGNWRTPGTVTPQNSTTIPAGAGFTIRKYPTNGGETVFWPLNPIN